MSGAQPKAAEIAGAASIIAEVDSSRIETRYRQGWVGHVTQDLSEAFRLAKEAMERREPCSVAYHGNVVDLLEYAEREQIHIELLSDQTSCLSKSGPAFFMNPLISSVVWQTLPCAAILR